MNVEYLIQLLDNKMVVLTNTKAQAFIIGDLVLINNVEREMAEVADTLYKLRLLLKASQEAGTMNSTLVELMKMPGILITDGSTACLNDYDISSYATDPLHEQKIADILTTMGVMDNPGVIDAYINNEAIGSPVTSQMILTAASHYTVDIRLMMAIMELDSRFGTAGVAVSTLNPGNVGNTGSETQSYPTWDDGVMAVAAWLNNHRRTPPTPEPTPITEPTATSTPPVATSTPPVVTPEPVATSTPPIVPPPTATSTPPVATSTPPVVTPEPVATSTPPVASSTPPVVTPPVATSTTPVATSTPPVVTPEVATRATKVVKKLKLAKK